MDETIINLYTDGACRGNPGKASFAFLIERDGKLLKKHSEYMGESTNNKAELTAIKAALNKTSGFGNAIEVYTDSNNAVCWLTGMWRIRNPHIRNLCNQIWALAEQFDTVSYRHVLRTHPKIMICDSMCNMELDKH